jgi:hypothetical protein
MTPKKHHTHARKHTHTHTHTHTHSHTLTHTHTHTHTPVRAGSNLALSACSACDKISLSRSGYLKMSGDFNLDCSSCSVHKAHTHTHTHTRVCL